MLKQGLYEQLIYHALSRQLEQSRDSIVSHTQALDKAEASKVIAKHLAEVIEKSLNEVSDGSDEQTTIHRQIEIANNIVSLIHQQTGVEDYLELGIDEQAEVLYAIKDRINTPHALSDRAPIIKPESSIAISSLFTGAVHEPSLYTEFNKEIASCDEIDMLISFIKWSGLRLIFDALSEFTQRGGRVRIITTSYMGATDIKAIDRLKTLQNLELKVSYDTKRTRLHAKSYIFYRQTGFTTAYVGSSNLSNAAISSGLEWNVKITAKDLPESIQKMKATFESYWNSSDFDLYTTQDRERLSEALVCEQHSGNLDSYAYHFAIKPYQYQQEILDQLDAERSIRHHYKNLIVAATGTGKTVISALDYKRFAYSRRGQKTRLLFIAHREEILRQSLSCFRGVLGDANFGELFVGSHRPEAFDHLFMSIQTFRANEWQHKTSADFYDYIVVDEFHHAAASSYQPIFQHYRPHILLGLTATPERLDGRDVTDYFDHRIAAEIRLPQAIERKLLSPFQYFGVTDTVDLSNIAWSKGAYDVRALTKVFALDAAIARKRAQSILINLEKYATSLQDVIGLGFCASVEHARFMADFFNEQGVPSISLHAGTPNKERLDAKSDLVSGKINLIFVVDLYNEGVDIPEVNTVLLLRPTESLTIFLQQLGRGLRLADNKECLTVLDFIGQAHKKYRFDEKFASLLNNTSKSVESEVKNGFPSLPKGCHIHLERLAKEYVLDNIRSALNLENSFIYRLSSFEEDTGLALNLSNFLNHYHLDPRIMYNRNSFSRLCAKAGLIDDFTEPMEQIMSYGFKQFAFINSRRFIHFVLQMLDRLGSINWIKLPHLEKAMFSMFYISIWQTMPQMPSQTVTNNLQMLAQSPVLLAELKSLLSYNLDKIDFVDESLQQIADCPLDVYCRYSKNQLLAGLSYANAHTMREGVVWLRDKSLDVFLNTLNKSEKEYSPTTMYQDYSINEWLFHWQSQSTTSEDSPTGRRYVHHGKGQDKVLLCVREFKQELGMTAPFTLLGTASYVSHEGSRPMSITYKLHRPIPARFLKTTNKLLIG